MNRRTITAAQRYAEARARLPFLAKTALTQLVRAAEAHKAAGWPLPYPITSITIDGVKLAVSLTIEPATDLPVPTEFVARAVVSRSGKLPSWADLVSVRAAIWPDDAMVFQVLPAGHEQYVDVADCLHLFGPWLAP